MAEKNPSKQGANRSRTLEPVRLNKFIADSGVCSRRKADQLIAEGQVMVNGKKVYELGVRVDPKQDKVTVGGKPIRSAQEFVYYMFHKPKNVVTTMDDPEGRPKVGDFIQTHERLFPVGRLDWDTEGLLLMTNDGQFAQNVAHPKKEIPKTYLAKINDKIDPAKLKKLTDGVSIIGGKVAAKSAEKVRYGKSDKYEWIKITITEGKNRQIRRMFEKIGYDVMKLKRISIGELKLGSLEKGEYRQLTREEACKVFIIREPRKAGFQHSARTKSQRKKSEKAKLRN